MSYLVLIFIGPLKEIANIILLGIMLGAVYTHVMLNESMDKITPALVFGLLLACRLVVYLQVKNRDQRESKAEPAAAERKTAVDKKDQ